MDAKDTEGTDDTEGTMDTKDSKGTEDAEDNWQNLRQQGAAPGRRPGLGLRLGIA